ncbi:MAG: PorT family protein [Cytophagales bacterium]|nr:MAG: PorT family protein [Cytophagales bacterium]
MKKLFAVSALMIIFLQSTTAQVKIGLLFSPCVNFNRVALNSDIKGNDISSAGSALGFIGGPEISFFFGSNENYSITTGAWYAVKRGKYDRKFTGKNDKNEDVIIDSSRNSILQYVQIPLTFKLYTNEIATDMKLYFQIGGSVDILVGGREVDSKIKSTKGYRAFDSSILIGSGIKYSLGENTAVLLGLRYTRGLLNVLDSSLRDNYKVNNDMISLDLGIQF